MSVQQFIQRRPGVTPAEGTEDANLRPEQIDLRDPFFSSCLRDADVDDLRSRINAAQDNHGKLPYCSTPGADSHDEPKVCQPISVRTIELLRDETAEASATLTQFVGSLGSVVRSLPGFSFFSSFFGGSGTNAAESEEEREQNNAAVRQNPVLQEALTTIEHCWSWLQSTNQAAQNGQVLCAGEMDRDIHRVLNELSQAERQLAQSGISTGSAPGNTPEQVQAEMLRIRLTGVLARLTANISQIDHLLHTEMEGANGRQDFLQANAPGCASGTQDPTNRHLDLISRDQRRLAEMMRLLGDAQEHLNDGSITMEHWHGMVLAFSEELEQMLRRCPARENEFHLEIYGMAASNGVPSEILAGLNAIHNTAMSRIEREVNMARAGLAETLAAADDGMEWYEACSRYGWTPLVTDGLPLYSIFAARDELRSLTQPSSTFTRSPEPPPQSTFTTILDHNPPREGIAAVTPKMLMSEPAVRIETPLARIFDQDLTTGEREQVRREVQRLREILGQEPPTDIHGNISAVARLTAFLSEYVLSEGDRRSRTRIA